MRRSHALTLFAAVAISVGLGCDDDASTTTDSGTSLDTGATSDVGPREGDPCRTSAECGVDLECLYWDAGCNAMGRCGEHSECRTDASVQYFCGCDGFTFQLASCLTEPWERRGICNDADAGPPPD